MRKFLKRLKNAKAAFFSEDEPKKIEHPAAKKVLGSSSISRRNLLTGTGLVAATAAFVATMKPSPAYAAMTVFDPSNLAKNAETAAQTAQLLLTSEGILKSADSTLKTLGLGGISSAVSSELFASTMGAAGQIYGAASTVNSVIGTVKKLEFAGRNLVGAVQNLGARGVAGKAIRSIKDISGAVSMAKSFVLAEPSSNAELGSVRQKFERQRKEVVQGAQSEALGASIWHVSDAIDSGRRVGKLANQAAKVAGANGDLRAQIAVQTSGILMIVEELSKNRQLVAASVGQQAVEGAVLLNTRVAPPPENRFLGQPEPQKQSPGNQVFGK